MPSIGYMRCTKQLEYTGTGARKQVLRNADEWGARGAHKMKVVENGVYRFAISWN